MTNLHDLKNRIESINKTKSITNAMHRIASSKLLVTQELYNNYQVFKNDFTKMLDNVVLVSKDSRFFQKNQGSKKRLYIVISADRGLVGGYHQNLFKAFSNEVKDLDPSDVLVIGIGKKAFSYFRKQPYTLVNEFIISNHDQIDAINFDGYIKNIITSYLNFDVEGIYICYTHFENTMKQTPMFEKLLPLKKPNLDDNNQRYVLFEGTSDEIMESFIHIYIQSRIFGSLVDSKMSEFSSRIMAMKRATDNAKDALEQMNIKYNQARQHKITNDLLDITNSKL